MNIIEKIISLEKLKLPLLPIPKEKNIPKNRNSKEIKKSQKNLSKFLADVAVIVTNGVNKTVSIMDENAAISEHNDSVHLEIKAAILNEFPFFNEVQKEFLWKKYLYRKGYVNAYRAIEEFVNVAFQVGLLPNND